MQTEPNKGNVKLEKENILPIASGNVTNIAQRPTIPNTNPLVDYVTPESGVPNTAMVFKARLSSPEYTLYLTHLHVSYTDRQNLKGILTEVSQHSCNVGLRWKPLAASRRNGGEDRVSLQEYRRFSRYYDFLWSFVKELRTWKAKQSRCWPPSRFLGVMHLSDTLVHVSHARRCGDFAQHWYLHSGVGFAS